MSGAVIGDVSAGAPGEGLPAASEHRLPPVTQVAVASLVCVVMGGIYMASHLPRHAPLGVAIGLLGVATALLAGNVIALARVREFAWRQFFAVARWALLAYVVIAGMLEYVFVFDHVKGSQLAVLSGMLAVFALDIPLLLAFSVARYQPPRTAAGNEG